MTNPEDEVDADDTQVHDFWQLTESQMHELRPFGPPDGDIELIPGPHNV